MKKLYLYSMLSLLGSVTASDNAPGVLPEMSDSLTIDFDDTDYRPGLIDLASTDWRSRLANDLLNSGKFCREIKSDIDLQVKNRLAQLWYQKNIFKIVQNKKISKILPHTYKIYLRSLDFCPKNNTILLESGEKGINSKLINMSTGKLELSEICFGTLSTKLALLPNGDIVKHLYDSIEILDSETKELKQKISVSDIGDLNSVNHLESIFVLPNGDILGNVSSSKRVSWGDGWFTRKLIIVWKSKDNYQSSTRLPGNHSTDSYRFTQVIGFLSNGDMVAKDGCDVHIYTQDSECNEWRKVRSFSIDIYNSYNLFLVNDNIVHAHDPVQIFDSDGQLTNTELSKKLKKFRLSSLAALSNKDIVVGSYDGIVRILDHKTYNVKTKWKGHASFVKSIIVFPDGNFATADGYGTAIIWDLQTRTPKHIYTLNPMKFLYENGYIRGHITPDSLCRVDKIIN